MTCLTRKNDIEKYARYKTGNSCWVQYVYLSQHKIGNMTLGARMIWARETSKCDGTTTDVEVDVPEEGSINIEADGDVSEFYRVSKWCFNR